jgi:outer membrane receptor protein involved in Fe transport
MSAQLPRAPARACAAALFAATLACVAGRAAACEQHERVEGRVRSADGRPVAAARIVLIGAHGRRLARSDAAGRFDFRCIESGTYDVVASAPGYQTLSERAVMIEAPHATLSLTLAPATTATLATIGDVSTSAGASVSTASAPSLAVSARRAAAGGASSVAQMLWNELSLTPVLPLGGGGNASVVYAVRGPDPTETLVAVDGHQVNNGSTGDFNLALLDPAALQEVQVIFGVAPSSLLGPNTIGGAVNIITLQPTQTPHALLRLAGGSYGNDGGTVQATGSDARLGYAVSLHATTSSGAVNRTIGTQRVGSGSSGTSALAKLRYQIGGEDGYGYVQVDMHDQTLMQDLSALLTTYVPPAYRVFANTGLGARLGDYGIDAQFPLGGELRDGTPATMLSFSHLTTHASQSVWGSGAGAAAGSCASGCQYLYNQRDVLGDDWVQIDHTLNRGLLTFKADLGTESLRTQYVPGQVQAQLVRAGASPAGYGPCAGVPVLSLPLSQTQRSAVLRYNGDPSSHVHFSLATYVSDFSTFGTSVDPRAGFVWTPTGQTAVRLSAGTTFQTPQLSELVALPASDRVPVGGIVYTGNPRLKPDRATEYDLGVDRAAGGRNGLRVSADLYQNDLRAPSSQLVVAPVPGCQSAAHPKLPCPVSYPVNAGAGIYRGVELRAAARVGAFDVRGGWSVDSSFLTQIPSSIQDGTLVAYEQSLGEPLHKAYLSFERNAARGLVYGADVAYEGAYNELNRPPYATLDAQIAYRAQGYEIGLYARNLTNVYADPFAIANGGVPYGTQPGNPMTPTDAYVMEGSRVVLVFTRSI